MFGYLLFELNDFVICDDESTVCLAFVLLDLIYVVFKLINHFSQLLVFIYKLRLHLLHADIIDLLVLLIHFFNLGLIKPVVILHLGCAELDL